MNINFFEKFKQKPNPEDPKEELKKGIEEGIKHNRFTSVKENLEKFTKDIENLDSEELKDLKGFTELAIKEKNPDASKIIIEKLGEIGINSFEETGKDEDYSKTYEVYKESESAIQTIESLKSIGKLSITENFKETTESVISTLENIGKAGAERGKKFGHDATRRVSESLGDIGVASAEKGEKFKSITLQAIYSLKDLGKITIEKKELGDAAWATIISFDHIGEASANQGKELEIGVRAAIYSLENIGNMVINQEQEEEREVFILRVVESLEHIGKATVENGLNEATKETIQPLLDIGKKTIEKNLKRTTEKAIESLLSIGRRTIKSGEGIKELAELAVSSLSELEKLDKETVQDTILKYKEQLEKYENKSDLYSFNRFLEAYRKERRK